MARVIQMNTDKLSNDAEEVKVRIANIRSQLKVLEEQAAVLDGMWSGPGSEAFKAVFYSDLNSLEAVMKNLDNLYRYENKALEKFSRCEQKVRFVLDELK